MRFGCDAMRCSESAQAYPTCVRRVFTHVNEDVKGEEDTKMEG